MVFEFSKIARKYPIGSIVMIRCDGIKEAVKVIGYQQSGGRWYIETKEHGIILQEQLEVMEIKEDKQPVQIGANVNIKM